MQVLKVKLVCPMVVRSVQRSTFLFPVVTRWFFFFFNCATVHQPCGFYYQVLLLNQESPVLTCILHSLHRICYNFDDCTSLLMLIWGFFFFKLCEGVDGTDATARNMSPLVILPLVLAALPGPRLGGEKKSIALEAPLLLSGRRWGQRPTPGRARRRDSWPFPTPSSRLCSS